MNQDDLLDRITILPNNICHGKSYIRGLICTVQSILELLASGITHREILEDYEDLEEEDLNTYLLFSAKISNVMNISQLYYEVFNRCTFT